MAFRSTDPAVRALIARADHIVDAKKGDARTHAGAHEQMGSPIRRPTQTANRHRGNSPVLFRVRQVPTG